ncbi:type IV toxin-antitoxin system AbiEi family antitoxin domain-containing protein [Guyparkeria sp.]|uniref:type IV toxin-antitoxin system AbiEi family antitoxin domain-containing protein n=1 Tax=Guyparkeria sp. TaxID=2035736 RepID=UPI003970A4A6
MKVNQLLSQIPYGAIVTTSWLASHGATSDQSRKLATSGWLQRVGHGAYCRAGDPLSWESGVFALQASSKNGAPPIWPGGQTALALQGFAHYVPMGHATTHLFVRKGSKVPKWMRNAEWSGRKAFHTESGLPTHLPGSFTDYQPPSGAFALQVSTPERAVLEWIAVSTNALLFSSDMVDTFSGLNTLRPRRLQALLEGCRSVKTKRAFMVLARHAGHAWYRRLDRTRLDLGKGKRQLWPGGKLDKEYLVTVPQGFTDDP